MPSKALFIWYPSEILVNNVPPIIKNPIMLSITPYDSISPDSTLSTIFSESDKNTMIPAIMNMIPIAMKTKVNIFDFFSEVPMIFVNLLRNGFSIPISESLVFF